MLERPKSLARRTRKASLEDGEERRFHDHGQYEYDDRSGKSKRRHHDLQKRNNGLAGKGWAYDNQRNYKCEDAVTLGHIGVHLYGFG